MWDWCFKILQVSPLKKPVFWCSNQKQLYGNKRKNYKWKKWMFLHHLDVIKITEKFMKHLQSINNRNRKIKNVEFKYSALLFLNKNLTLSKKKESLSLYFPLERYVEELSHPLKIIRSKWSASFVHCVIYPPALCHIHFHTFLLFFSA